MVLVGECSDGEAGKRWRGGQEAVMVEMMRELGLQLSESDSALKRPCRPQRASGSRVR